ncbi:pantothenate kinase [Litoreibacter ponti]|uniref:Pantothenate kinase n=1 Tax=Litoreibacter ponti TaxID=1510457 RepID=A0A2T6BJD0_9RHOB|nr:AAA family ATPase [Litoreibacter ponti]PTX56164.1 pantothenate kinase [Litoreibacter ponti]
MDLASVTARIAAAPFKARRRLVALVGPPASGKSTLSEQLPQVVPASQVVPMDGFHLDNSLLAERGLSTRKGAPETFDIAGLTHLVRRLADEEEVIFPLFDRARDAAIAGAGIVGPEVDTVIVEGNYLLLDRPGWRKLAAMWDISILLTAPEDVLRDRLLQRWRDFGYAEGDAVTKTETNDLPNARTVLRESLPADITISSER